MEKIKVKAEVREMGRKGVNRRLRKSGSIPAILYGQSQETLGLSVASKEFTSLMKGASGTNVLIDLELVGKTGSPIVVMLKDYQIDALSLKISHIDLLKIDLTHKLTVKVPLKLVGKSIGIVKGGLVEQNRREIEVKCLPTDIPSLIEVDITNLDLGHSLHVNELKLPQGVELPHGADFPVVSIVLPREEVAETPAADAAAAPAAGEAAAAPAAEAAGKPEKGEKEKK